MTYVALALVAANMLILVGAARLIRNLGRQHARERDLLLNQLLHATGKPWQPAPANEARPPAEPARRMFIARPELLADQE